MPRSEKIRPPGKICPVARRNPATASYNASIEFRRSVAMLRISLRDGEKAIVNGAVLRASGRVTLYLENHAAILRGRDVMRPEEANTAARQLYFACMLAYIDPDGRDKHQQSILALISAVVTTATDPRVHVACVRFAHEAARGDYYKALSAARELIACEAASLEPAVGAESA